MPLPRLDHRPGDGGWVNTAASQRHAGGLQHRARALRSARSRCNCASRYVRYLPLAIFLSPRACNV
eukprot:6198997-Pleurochrysis_carterae.AAC.1